LTQNSLKRRGNVTIWPAENCLPDCSTIIDHTCASFDTTRREDRGLAMGHQIMIAESGTINFDNQKNGNERFTLIC